jgi:hypothetical protein
MKYRLLRGNRWLSDDIAANIIAAAERGLMTEAAKSLIVVPDTRHGKPDIAGIQAMQSVKWSECRTLAQKYPRCAKTPF